jgi:3,4-dihydroxy 2-butanone 4-phosphate synthase / GTP cyclohydrolase II
VTLVAGAGDCCAAEATEVTAEPLGETYGAGMGLNSVTAAIEAVRAGRMVVVVDDPERENEGDLVMAASRATPDAVNFMAREGRGLICVPMTRERLDALAIPPMVRDADDRHRTAFHVGVDLLGQATGISAYERAETIRALADPSAVAADFTRPGHVFPLAYCPGGLHSRAGHTEASVDLVRVAGAGDAAVICEIAAEDGEMMRFPELSEFARAHQLPLVTIAQLQAHLEQPPSVTRVISAQVPLPYGVFTLVGFKDHQAGREHLAAVFGDIGSGSTLVRVHSECLTGDVFGSKRCDCGAQLEQSLAMIANAGAGVVVYLRGHEGRGIGLLEKLSAYQLQDRGLDTVEANFALGHPADARDYGVGAAILADLGVTQVRLLTNNPAKREGLERYGVSVAETVRLVSPVTAENVRYLSTKRTKLRHDLDSSMAPVQAPGLA